MLLVLHGAKKNVGDFLIRERGLALLRHLRPDQEIITSERWRPLAQDLVALADAVVLCGGPGLQENFYPETFPLSPDIDALATPILPLALGWSGTPAGRPEQFSFDEPSRRALTSIHTRIDWSSVRDDVSLQILRTADVGEVRRSGCTAWYHLPSLGAAPAPPSTIRSVVFTPPAGSRRLFVESLRIMRLLRARYPQARRYCVFHRGLRADGETTRKEVVAVRAMAAVASSLGFEIVDAAYDLSRIDFYGDADLHVGYRVHAHLCFVSQHRPSLLISEDGRGVGQAVTLGDPYSLYADSPGLVARIDSALSIEEREGHPLLRRAVDEIERTWPVMRETIEQLPTGAR
jgi:polysaccharide pyruvyl transferase WcaK-like protein